MTMVSNYSLPFLSTAPIQKEEESKPKSLFNEKELEDFRRFASFFSWEATQENSAYNSRLKEAANLNSPMILDSEPEKLETSLPTSPLEQSNKEVETPKAIQTPAKMTREYFKRFKRVDNPEEKELSQIAESVGLGDIGTLSYSPFSNGEFRLGTLGFHEASVLGTYQGSLLELITTNQNTIWAQTNLFMNTDLFRDSPAMNPIIESKPMFDMQKVYLPTYEGSDIDVETDAYIKEDGSLLRIRDFMAVLGVEVPPELVNRQDEVVTPDTVVNYAGETPITASQIMPLVDTVKSPGLGALMRSEFEESFFQYNIGAVNNWERFGRIGDYGTADRSSYGFDLSVIPLLDVFEAYVSPETTNPAWIALNQSQKINGASLVKELKERDPILYQAWTEEGVNWEVLSNAKNAGEFRAHVNSVFVNNAIARAMTTSWINDPYFNYVRQAREMAYSTLTSGDAVAQSVIMAATAGLSAGASASLTARTALSVQKGAQASRATLLGNLRAARSFQTGLQTVNKFLPVNLPGTALELTAAKFGTSVPRLASLHNKVKAGGWALRGSAWTVGQSIEGFVEEGLTDVLNQGYESIYGLRTNYDLGQTFDQAIAGALMEPILGTALTPVNIATSVVINSPTYALVNGAKLVGFNGKRVREFNAYLSQFQGSWEDLSTAEQEVRMEMIARGLVFENTFGSFIDGDYSSAEKAHNSLKNLAIELSGLGSNLNPGTIMEAAILFGDKLKELNNAVKTNKLTPDQITKLIEAKSTGVLNEDSDGNLKLNSDLAELLLGFVVLGGEGRNTIQIKQKFLQMRLEKEVTKQWELDNKQLIEDAQKEKDKTKKSEMQKKLLDLFNEKLNNPDQATLKKIENLEKQQELLFGLLPGVSETIQNNELDEQTITTINTAHQSIQETIEDAVTRITEEFNASFNQISSKTAETTEPRTPEEAPTVEAVTEAVPEAAQAPAEAVPEAAQAPAEAVPEVVQPPVEKEQEVQSQESDNLKKVIQILNNLGIDSDIYLKTLRSIHNESFADMVVLIEQVSTIYSEEELKKELKELISC